MTADPHAVQISVDGSCYPNEGRKSGYAGVVVYPDDPTEHQVVFQGFKESTINRMELSACIATMKWVKIECGDTEQSLNGLTVGPFGRGRSIDLGMKGAGSRLQSTARSGQMSWEVRDVFKFSR